MQDALYAVALDCDGRLFYVGFIENEKTTHLTAKATQLHTQKAED